MTETNSSGTATSFYERNYGMLFRVVFAHSQKRLVVFEYLSVVSGQFRFCDFLSSQAPLQHNSIKREWSDSDSHVHLRMHLVTKPVHVRRRFIRAQVTLYNADLPHGCIMFDVHRFPKCA